MRTAPTFGRSTEVPSGVSESRLSISQLATALGLLLATGAVSVAEASTGRSTAASHRENLLTAAGLRELEGIGLHPRNENPFVYSQLQRARPYTLPLSLSLDFDPEEKERIAEILQRYIDAVIDFVPPIHGGTRWLITPKDVPHVTVDHASKRILVPRDKELRTEQAILHALIELLHGEYQMGAGFAGEGMTTAILNAVQAEMNVQAETDSTPAPSGEGDLPEEESLALPFGISYHAVPPLANIRMTRAANVWLELENAYPGFIRTFHERWGGLHRNNAGSVTTDVLFDFCEWFDRSGSSTEGVMHQAHSIDIVKRSAMVIGAEKPKEGKQVYAILGRGSDGSEHVQFVTAERDNNGNERARENKKVIFQCTASNGISLPLSVRTDSDGQARVSLKTLQDRMGIADRYDLLVSWGKGMSAASTFLSIDCATSPSTSSTAE